jgi:hypothetical protein
MSSISGNRNIKNGGGKKSRKGSRKDSRKHSNKRNDLYEDFAQDLINDINATPQYNNLYNMANPALNPMLNPTLNPDINSFGMGLDPKSIDPLHLNYMVSPSDQNISQNTSLGISYEQMMNGQNGNTFLNNLKMSMGKQ